MRELLIVLNVKAMTFMKSATDFRISSLLKNLSSFLIFGGVAVGVFLLARMSTIYLIQEAHIGQFLYHRFLSMLFYVFFITVNLGNMIVCYATLYRSEEVRFLMGLPISHQKIFLLKFIDNFFYSSSTMTLLGLSWLLGYGSCYDMPWYFYFLTMFMAFLPFMLISAILAVLFLMALIKVAVHIGVRWLLAGVTIIYISAIYLYFHVTNPVQLVQEVMKYYPYVNQYFGFLDAPFSRFLPNHWVSEFLYWSVTGNSPRALPWFFLLNLVCLGLVIVAAFIARHVYYPSWLAASDASAMRGPRLTRLRLKFMEFGVHGVWRPQTDALVKRDFWLFFREPGQWLHLLLIFVLLLVFLISLGSLEIRVSQPVLQVMSFLVVFLFNGFLVASVALRFVFPAVSLESDAFWCVRAAPVSLTKLYYFKLGIALCLVLVMAETLTIASTVMLRNDAFLARFAALCMAFVSLSLTGLNLGAGAYFATYREKNAIRVASSQGASLTFLGSMVYLTSVAMILVLPLKRYFDSVVIRGVVLERWVYVPVLLIGLISLLVFGLATGAGLRAFKRDY